MQSSGRRILRIISDVKRPTYSNVFNVFQSAVLQIVVLLALPLYLRFYVNDIASHELLVGDDTLKLAFDYIHWEKQPQIAYSVWREQETYINGSTYERSHFSDPHLFLFCCTFYNWNLAFNCINFIIFYSAKLIFIILNELVKKFGWKRLVVFVTVSFLLNFVLICGGWNFIVLVSGVIQRSIHAWFDNQVTEFTFSEIIMGENIPHPLTLGKEPPFYLTTFYRYNKEDVVFTCEYHVWSGKAAFPIYKSANWRKHGQPVIFNERIYVNISIQLLDNSGQLDLYSIKSTLTIEMIEETDFGGYTCVYYNPLRSRVKPGASMWQNFNAKASSPPDSTHDPKCQCNPRKKVEQPKKCQFSRQSQWGANEQMKDGLENCFTEFRLAKINEQIISHALHPGSIFITGAHYVTTTDIEDLEYDVSLPSDHQNGRSCCSKLVWLYWYWFRGGYSQSPPFTRTLIDGDTKYFTRYQCVCPSAYGTKDFTFSRKYFNHTTGLFDLADVVFPMKLRLIPTLSHPWSASDGLNILNLDDESLSCWGSDFTSESHLNRICAVINMLLESTLENLIFYEAWILNVSIVIILIFVSLVPLTLHRCCSRPILTACLTYGRREKTLAAVKGEPINYLGARIDHRTDTNLERFRYQFFISYEDSNEFDIMIAQHIKGLLMTKNMSVFDMTDIIPGTPGLTAVGDAIASSYRFVVIASKNYFEDELKSLEFDSIQRVIVSQKNKLKERLIIIQTETFEIQRIYRVPHILIHEVARDEDAIDELSLTHFLQWETATRPPDVPGNPCYFYSNIKEVMNRKLALAVGILLCFVAISFIGMW